MSNISINPNFTSIEQVAGTYLNPAAEARPLGNLITLSEEQSLRLEEGVQKAQAKGITDSLVLVDTLAFIVNVPNQTVVTAMDQTESEENIFTNIDGAVIV